MSNISDIIIDIVELEDQQKKKKQKLTIDFAKHPLMNSYETPLDELSPNVILPFQSMKTFTKRYNDKKIN
jgi:hypothetical protein